jgi:hypothetical protein
VPRAAKLSALAALFAAGFLAAAVIVSGGRAQVVATRTETTVETETTTAPGTTETVELTTTRKVILPTSTAETASNDNDIPTWVWVLLGALALGVVVLLVLMLTRRGGGGGGVSVEERQRHLDGAVGSWVAQGWAVESQTADSAVLRRGGDLTLVSVDQAGHVSTQPLSAPPT